MAVSMRDTSNLVLSKSRKYYVYAISSVHDDGIIVYIRFMGLLWIYSNIFLYGMLTSGRPCLGH